jgi:hypothetical protein
MNEGPSANPSVSRDDERRWFRWTVGSTAGLFLGVATWAFASYLAHKLMLEINATLSAAPGPIDLDYVEEKSAPIKTLASTTGGLLLVCGLGFLFCFTKWLLAIRRRRTAEAAAFGAPPPSG